MQEFQLDVLEEYRPEKFVVKPVYAGNSSKGMLLHLLPNQEVPLHPHTDWEVTLIPRRGEAVLFYEDGTEVALKTGALYFGGQSPVFGMQNRGPEPFQTVVLLARSEGISKP